MAHLSSHKLACSPGSDIYNDGDWKRSKVIPASTAESFDPRVNADCRHSHCRQKPDVSGVKWVFLASVKGA